MTHRIGVLRLAAWYCRAQASPRSPHAGPESMTKQSRNRRRANLDGKPQNHPMPLKKARPSSEPPHGPECVSPDNKLGQQMRQTPRTKPPRRTPTAGPGYCRFSAASVLFQPQLAPSALNPQSCTWACQQEHALTQDKPAGQPREARPKTPQRTTGYQKAECQTQT
jgi:hypothetical protein